jgi:hypothetical protein
MNECDDQTSTIQEGSSREDIRAAKCSLAVKYPFPLSGNASVSSEMNKRVLIDFAGLLPISAYKRLPFFRVSSRVEPRNLRLCSIIAAGAFSFLF